MNDGKKKGFLIIIFKIVIVSKVMAELDKIKYMQSVSRGNFNYDALVSQLLNDLINLTSDVFRASILQYTKIL